MSTRSPHTLPPRLQAARQRLERWRYQRKTRRIPECYWRSAVALAEEFGVHRTAKALRLNYRGLKARVNATAPPPVTDAPRFVELLIPATAPSASPCVVELDDGHGRRMSVRLAQADPTVLAALTRAWARGAR